MGGSQINACDAALREQKKIKGTKFAGGRRAGKVSVVMKKKKKKKMSQRRLD